MSGTIIFLEPKGTILEVVREAKKRGYRVVAFTSDETLLQGAPGPYRSAVSMIDKVIKITSWEDMPFIESLVDKIASEGSVAGIYSGMDPCAIPTAMLRKKFGLPTPDPATLALVLDKHQLRNRLRELGLSRLQTILGSVADTWSTWDLSGSAYFKPVRGFFSAYVKKCSGLADLRAAQSEWRDENAADPIYVKNYLRSKNQYHLEEAFEGELLSVEAFSENGVFRPLGLLSRILFSKDPIVEMGSCFPYPHPFQDKIIKLVKVAHEELGLLNGPTHTEVIVKKNGDAEIIDLNPRFVGADVMQSINFALDIRIQDALLDFALGNPTQLPTMTKNYSCLQYFLPPSVEVLEAVDFPDELEVRFHAQFMELGTKISSTNRQLDYLGCYLTVMPSFEAAIRRSLELRTQVTVNRRYGGVF